MPALAPPRLCLTRSEVAQLVGVSVASVPALVRKGVIPKPIPGTRRWSRDHLQEHLLQRSKGGQDGQSGEDYDWSV